MPAKSKDQQRAAAIALKAKKEGRVDSLSAGAAKNMAKSMTEKELDKFASTKHKGLPENKPNESWAGTSLSEMFTEEMLGTDEEGEAITSDKPTIDQIEDAGRDKEDDTGWDAYDDSWDSKVNADAPMAQSGRPMGSNVTGAARVSYESKDPNSLDILFEQNEREYYMADEHYDLNHSSDYEHDYDDQQGIAASEYEGERLHEAEEDLLDYAMSFIDNGTIPNLSDAKDFIDDALADLGREDMDTWDLILYNHAGEGTPGSDLSKDSSEMLARRLIEKAIKLAKDSNLDEQSFGLDDWAEEDWNPQTTIDPVANEIENRLHGSLINDMVDHLITHHDLHGKSPSEWSPEALLADFEYDYSVSPNSSDDLSAAEEAIERAKEEIDDIEELHFESKQHAGRWKELAGILLEEKNPENPKEAMIGGVSNSAPNPGHRAKMNEDSTLELLAQEKGHRIDVFDARDELAGLAYEIAGAIQGMHLDTTDRRTEKMTQNKMVNMYKFLSKLKGLTN